MGFEGFAFHPVWNLGDYQKANAVFIEARLQAPNKDLSECVDEEGFVYSIEKYCYSTPSNLMKGVIEDSWFCHSCEV